MEFGNEMLNMADVHTYYGDSHVLHGISIAISRQSVVSLLGRNGMGKTTTIWSIMGFTPPKEGIISFKGRDVTRLESFKIAQMGIGLIPQGRRLFPSLSVKENLTMAARTRGKAHEWSLEKIYAQFPILQKRSAFGGNLLSGGEQQMLAIGRALMTNPVLLLMDEPSEGLAPMIVRDIGLIILRLKDQGLSILLVEQNLPMALEVSDYTFIMSKGIIVYESPPHELENNEDVKLKYLCATE